jgi:hypothetical protein
VSSVNARTQISHLIAAELACNFVGARHKVERESPLRPQMPLSLLGLGVLVDQLFYYELSTASGA